MEKIKKAYSYIREKYKILARRKYTTVAGTLVFFFVMSIVPLSFWLTLLIGKLPVDTDKILQLPVFASVKNIFTFIRQEAQNATAVCGIS